MNIKSYSELVLLPTFEDRFEYLRLDGIVGETTFGFDRYMNQVFYRSLEWKKIRDTVIARDLGCDLGIEGDIWSSHHSPSEPDSAERSSGTDRHSTRP